MKFFPFMILSVLLIGCSNHQSLERMKFSGTVEITEHVLGTKLPSRVETLTVKEGDRVAKGQILATFDRYAQANKDLARAKSLYRVGGSTQQNLELAQLAVDDQAIISPIDGIVLLKTVEVGETIGAGSAVVVIGNPSQQWIKIFVPEGVVNQVQMNQAVNIIFDGSSKRFEGHVSFIATQAEFTPRNVQTPEERVTQAFMIKVSFNNPDLTIHPGVSADVQFVTKKNDK